MESIKREKNNAHEKSWPTTIIFVLSLRDIAYKCVCLVGSR